MEIFKYCSRCTTSKPQSEFARNHRAKDGYNWTCRSCGNISNKKYKAAHQDKVKAYNREYDRLHPGQKAATYAKNRLARKNKRLQVEFGITLADYNQMSAAQNHVCAICGKPETEVERGKTPKTLSVDHNHTNNKVRALLCQRCNKGIGMFLENTTILQSAIAYLETHNVA